MGRESEPDMTEKVTVDDLRRDIDPIWPKHLARFEKLVGPTTPTMRDVFPHLDVDREMSRALLATSDEEFLRVIQLTLEAIKKRLVAIFAEIEDPRGVASLSERSPQDG
jgi:hypothetical protein